MEQPAQQQQNAVSLKLPAFWTSQPKVWFQQSEAQFTLRNITADDTKYYYVVAALDQDYYYVDQVLLRSCSAKVYKFTVFFYAFTFILSFLALTKTNKLNKY